MNAKLLSRPQRLDRDWREYLRDQARQGGDVKIWNTLKTNYKISDFLSWQEQGSLLLNPYFQRRSVWKLGAKSYFIDTIIRNFPIPILFLRDRQSDLRTLAPVRDVIDGQQRLRTVIAYIKPELLKDFDPARDDFRIKKEHNEELQGRKFAQLPVSIQRAILDYQFSVNVFPSDTGDREVTQIFARMNSSGYKLNDQELRNAEYFGAFKTRIENLATEQLDRWRAWKVCTPDDLARMVEVEMASEFAIVMMKGVSEKDDKTISSFYEDYDEEFAEGPEVARRFRTVFQSIDENFAHVIPKLFRKRTLFYALWAAVYDLQFGIGSGLGAKRMRAKELTKKSVEAIIESAVRIADETAPKKVMDSTTRRTTHVRERTVVVNYLIKNA